MQRADDGRVSVPPFSLPPAASNYSYASRRVLDAIRREARASARDPDSADARRGKGASEEAATPCVRCCSLVGNHGGSGGDGARASKRGRERGVPE